MIFNNKREQSKNMDKDDVLRKLGLGDPNKFEKWKKEAFKKYINQTNKRFYNDNKDCAKFLINLMIGTAEDNVYIYSGNLPEYYYGQAFKSTNAKTINILVDNDTDVNWVNEYKNKNKKIKYTKLKESTNTPNHFFLVDKKSFRYETNKKVGTAIANFNEEETVSKGIRLFNKLREESKVSA